MTTTSTGYSDVAFGDDTFDSPRKFVGTRRMNPVVRDAWIGALESGAYRQGTSRLVSRTRTGAARWWCCLGVLCDLAEHAGVVKFSATDADFCSIVEFDDGARIVECRSGKLPEVVARWAGLWNDDPYVNAPVNDRRGFTYNRLSFVNDSGQYDFPQIAELIRTYL